MGLLFKNDLFDQLGTWPLAYFYNAFTTAAGRFVEDAHEQL